MKDESRAVLLDTCAVIWLANGDPLPREATARITAAGVAGGILVSPITAWEIGMLGRIGSGRSAIQFLPDPKAWLARFMARPGIRQAAFTPEIAIESSYLPGDLHSDPADRLIIATARHQQVPVVTRDRKIIAYGAAGFVDVIPC